MAIPYGVKVEKVRKVLVDAALKLDGVRKDPSPDVVVQELADSGVNVNLRVWIDNARDEQKYQFALTELCKDALDKAKITIPFPQRDVHMIKGK